MLQLVSKANRIQSRFCFYSRENTVNVQAFVASNAECEKSCSRDDLCGYYKVPFTSLRKLVTEVFINQLSNPVL